MGQAKIKKRSCSGLKQVSVSDERFTVKLCVFVWTGILSQQAISCFYTVFSISSCEGLYFKYGSVRQRQEQEQTEVCLLLSLLYQRRRDSVG